MRSRYRNIAMAAAGMLLMPQLATATDVEAELQQMQERMARMEEQLEATNEQLDSAQETALQQQAVLEDAGIDEERGVVSGLSSFLEATDFNAWVATSYTYKAQAIDKNPQPTAAGNVISSSPVGKVPQFGPGYTNANTFSLDQLWFEIDKSPTEESRGGMHADLAYGAATNNVPGFGPIYTAYASWLAPLGNGLLFDGGVMGTLIGAEVIQTNANFNITRGLVWGLQPINVTGASASYELFDGFSVTARIVNENLSATISDPNPDKSFEGQIAYATDKFGVYLNGGYGRSAIFANVFDPVFLATPTGVRNTVGLADLVLTADPLDNLSVWLDVLWRNQRFNENFVTSGGGGLNLDATLDDVGVAVAARIGILENTGFALRGEWVGSKLHNVTLINTTATPPSLVPASYARIDAWSVTATVDQGLTDNLEFNAEFRYDGSSPGITGITGLPGLGDGFLLNSNGLPRSAATYGFVLQLLYEF